MEDKGSKRRAFAIFGLLFAGLAITLAMILRQVPDPADQRGIVAALTQDTPPPTSDHRGFEGETDESYDYDETELTEDEAPAPAFQLNPRTETGEATADEATAP